MRKRNEFAAGIVLAPVAYYAASVASVLWLSGQQSLVVAAIAISMTAFAALSVISCLLPHLSLALSATILVLLIISIIFGGAEYAWAAPLPLDFATLFFHGSHSPLVFCIAAATLATSLMKLWPRNKRAS